MRQKSKSHQISYIQIKIKLLELRSRNLSTLYKSEVKFHFARTIHQIRYYMFFYYKHMKFWIQARLCVAIYNFEACIMLNFSRYQTTSMRKNLTPM